MTTYALIEEAQAAGIKLQAMGEYLKLTGPEDVVEQWKSRIIFHKQDILALARSQIGSSSGGLNSEDGASIWMFDYPISVPATLVPHELCTRCTSFSDGLCSLGGKILTDAKFGDHCSELW